MDLDRFCRGVQVAAKLLWELPKEIWDYKPLSLDRMDYDMYWNEIGGSVGLAPRVSVIAERIEMGTSVLDLGCGDGTLLAYLAATRQSKVSGIDVSERALALARQKGLEDLRQVDLSDPDFRLEGCYNYVVITEVLEHVPNPEDLMCKLVGHFNRKLFVSIPNIGFYTHRLRLLFGRFPQQWGKHPGEHLRFWTLSDFRWWATHLGYRVLEMVPTNGFPRLFRILPGLFAKQVVFVLEPSGEGGPRVRRTEAHIPS